MINGASYERRVNPATLRSRPQISRTPPEFIMLAEVLKFSITSSYDHFAFLFFPPRRKSCHIKNARDYPDAFAQSTRSTFVAQVSHKIRRRRFFLIVDKGTFAGWKVMNISRRFRLNFYINLERDFVSIQKIDVFFILYQFLKNFDYRKVFCNL